jgi:hypothetical protein
MRKFLSEFIYFQNKKCKKNVSRDKFIIPKTSLYKTLYFKIIQLKHIMIKNYYHSLKI